MTNCPITSCPSPVQPPLPLCARHWYRVPAVFRVAFWNARQAPVEAELQSAVADCIAHVMEALPAPAVMAITGDPS